LDNVILTSKQIDKASAKLVDFGLAAFLEGARNNKYSAFVEEANKPEQEWSPLLRSKSRRVDSVMRNVTFVGLPATSFTKDQMNEIQGEMTGLAGSYGYMAPEVFNGQPYNEKADIFSFGVLMYNLCYRVIPSLMIMSNGDTEDVIVYAKRVSEGFRQPLNDEKVPSSMNALIEACWHQSPGSRPAAASIVEQISELLEKGSYYTVCNGNLSDFVMPFCLYLCIPNSIVIILVFLIDAGDLSQFEKPTSSGCCGECVCM